MPDARRQATRSAPSPATVAAPGVRGGTADYSKELAKLNRHWYRRCLDDLGRSLQEAGTSPTVAELEDLCDQVITTFLRSITSQAPDSESPQFPADRAYFIPFEGDRAGKFNYAKPYYQILEVPSTMTGLGGPESEGIAESLWSCLPWFGGEVRIDPDASVRNGETLMFRDLLALGPDSERRSGTREGPSDHLRVRKSLLLRDDDEDVARGRRLLRLLRGENRTEGSVRRARSRTRDMQRGEPRDGLRKALRAALAEVFEAYRLAPGKAEIEELLGNQMDVLRWLAGLAGLTKGGEAQWGTTQNDRGGQGSIQLSNEPGQFDALLKMLLQGYFLDAHTKTPELESEAVLQSLHEWVRPREWDAVGDTGNEDEERGEAIAEDLARTLFAHLTDLHETPFFRAVRERQEEQARKDDEATPVGPRSSGGPRAKGQKGRSLKADSLSAEIKADVVVAVLKELGKHLESFAGYFLKAQRELDLEQRVRTSTKDDPRRAGSAETSFVWVCPDFEDLRATLPSSRAVGLEDKEVHAIERGRRGINEPYRRIFRQLEVEILQDHASAISNYWRMRGQAAREERLFGSFENKLSRMATPPAVFGNKIPKDPFPQNIFLRVRICDSLNEPVIDGLFVFSTDYDEVKVWNKFSASRAGSGRAEAAPDSDREAGQEDVRADDIQDLLSFAKVFFFIVRDYLHGLDRARESADIGLLNQFLYDRRLTHLERRLDATLTAPGTESVPLTDERRWQPLVYELLNNYAHSLLDKPEDVRNETFPYDRLLLVPLAEGRSVAATGARGNVGGVRPLPFYLFQSIFVDCEDGSIDGSHYSLVKPFQSPVEKSSSEQQQRFLSRSFQKVYELDGRKVRLPNYLEKHYVGAVNSDDLGVDEGVGVGDGTQVESWVVKKRRRDRGDEWAGRALLGFWRERVRASGGTWASQGEGRDLSEGEKTFIQFLSRLTRDLEELDRRRPADLREAVLQFLLRFSLLRALLVCLHQNGKKDATLEKLERHYRETELKLKFDDAQDLDVLRLADVSILAGDRAGDLGNLGSTDIVERLITGGRSRREKEGKLPDPFEEVAFHSFLLGADEPFLVELFRYFTERVLQSSNDPGESVASNDEDGPPRTWYQPILTRPLKKRIADVIGPLIPPYEDITSGEDAMAFFLGTVNLEVGRGQRDVKRLRCLVAMIRDYDDSRGNLYLSEKDLKERLEGDLKDLTLFTQTFFKSAQRNLNVARERQQVRVLTDEIQDIARSWYSRGMDRVGRDLRDVLEALLRRAEVPRLDRLQPETMERLFQTAVEVLCEEQTSRDGRTIELESFPFDRVLHVPILFGADQAACLSYVRTRPARPDEGYESPYHAIRAQGRHKLLGGGRKQQVQRPPFHLHIASSSDRSLLVEPERPLRSMLEFLADSHHLDKLVRRLYQAEATQTLALAGTVHHLLRIIRAETRPRLDGGDGTVNLDELARRMEDVLRKNVQSIDQMVRGGPAGSGVQVQTAVFMDPTVTLDRFGGSAREPFVLRDAERRLSDLHRLPVFADLFQAIEGDGWAYGLAGERVRSKVFYVYYSVPVPKGFLEDLDTITGSPCYSGVFCLVLDDVSTDDKLGDRSAEEADQADIRTFFHNVMDRMRLVLEQQALKYQLVRPGTEQFVTGMLHRLKNELNEPAKAFAILDTVLCSGNGLGAEQPVLLERMRQAQTSIGSIREIFKQLKGFSEKQQGIIPRRTYSSTVVGWIYVESLCSAVIKELRSEEWAELSSKTVSKLRKLLSEARAEHERIERLQADKLGTDGKTGDDSSERRPVELRDSGAEIQRIQRCLHRLGGHLEALVGERGRPVELIFSFDVFALEGLQVRGSYQLQEALNILVENAFQAAWSYLSSRVDEASTSGPPVSGQVRMVCRRSDLRRDEVLLEIFNTARELTPEFKARLNAPVAQPIMARRYSKSGGQKRGGSGFGHYFARQIVAETCGGRAVGRELGVEIEDLEKHLIRVRVNLLEATSPKPRRVKLAELLEWAEKVFSESKDGLHRHVDRAEKKTPDLRSRDCWLPEDVDPAELLQATRAVLEADRQRKEEELLHLLRDTLLPKVELSPTSLVGMLKRATRHLVECSGGKGKGAKALRELAGQIEKESSMVGSFERLKEQLESWYRRDRTALKRIVANASEAGVPALEQQLDRFLVHGELLAIDTLTDSERVMLARRWESIRPYLQTEDDIGFLFELLEQHWEELKQPDSKVERLAGLFKEERWHPFFEAEAQHVVLKVELSDTDRTPDDDPEEGNPDLKELRHVPLAATFVQYRSSIRNGNGVASEKEGVSADLRLSRWLDPSREGACQVLSREAELKLRTVRSGPTGSEYTAGR